MQKYLLLLLITTTGSVLATTGAGLFNAVQESNITLVHEILTKNSLTIQEKTAYLDLAQEVIKRRRQEIGLEDSSKIKYAIIAGSFATLSIASILSIHGTLEQVMLFKSLSFLAYSIVFVINIAKAHTVNQELTVHYQNAVKIKMLLSLAPTNEVTAV